MTSNVTVRLLLTNKEAGIVIGTKGATIQELRTDFDIKVGISEHVDGCVDRICSMHGPNEDVAKACDLIAEKLSRKQKIIRVLMSHFAIGSLIGKEGINMKDLQKEGIRVSCLDDILPQSTDRIVLVIGDKIEYGMIKILDLIKEVTSKNIYYDPNRVGGHSKGVLYRSNSRNDSRNDSRSDSRNEHGKNGTNKDSEKTNQKTSLQTSPKTQTNQKTNPKTQTNQKTGPSTPATSTRKISIPKTLQSKVLGENDEQLTKIGYDCGVKFDKQYQSNGVLTLKMRGEEKQLTSAMEMIRELTNDE